MNLCSFWGKRKLEDDWRRFNKKSLSTIEGDSLLEQEVYQFGFTMPPTLSIIPTTIAQDTIDIEITAKEIHGMSLRNLRFPSRYVNTKCYWR